MTLSIDLREDLPVLLKRLLAERGPQGDEPVRPPVFSHPVGVPGWHDPEPLDPFAVLPDVAEHVDLVVRGEDGGYVVYVTVEPGSSWVALVRVVLSVVAMALPGVVPSRIGRVHLTRVVPTAAVLEVCRVPGGAVDVRLQGLAGRGFLELRHLR